jgi:hypothetical protein
LIWCALFVNTCYRADNMRQFKRLLWLLPLVLFAFVAPAGLIWLAFSLWLAGLEGKPPM